MHDHRWVIPVRRSVVCLQINLQVGHSKIQHFTAKWSFKMWNCRVIGEMRERFFCVTRCYQKPAQELQNEQDRFLKVDPLAQARDLPHVPQMGRVAKLQFCFKTFNSSRKSSQRKFSGVERDAILVSKDDFRDWKSISWFWEHNFWKCELGTEYAELIDEKVRSIHDWIFGEAHHEEQQDEDDQDDSWGKLRYFIVSYRFACFDVFFGNLITALCVLV